MVSGEFVARMEDILDIYKQVYDPLRPVICFDETNRQLIEETRKSIEMKQGQPERIDFEYRRNGVVNLFMMFEPLSGKRFVRIEDRRTKKEFAYAIKDLVDNHYSHVEKIIIVMDNLNTHHIGSLYEAFEPSEAKRIADKIDIHYTPKHGSWLNMAEIEIGVMSKQCLSRYIPTKEKIQQEVKAWYIQRNNQNTKADWQFTTEDARIKLKKLYPKI